MKNIFRKTRRSIYVLAVTSIALMAFIPANAQVLTSHAAKQIQVNFFTGDAVFPYWNQTVRAPTANHPVPFRALMTGSAAFTSATTVEFHTTGLATHLGNFVASGFADLFASTGNCPGGPNIPNVHTETLTAANGDELVIQMQNVACPTGPYTYHGIGHWTIIGGTGRFQNITGRGTNEGHADFEIGTFEMAYTGTLGD